MPGYRPLLITITLCGPGRERKVKQALRSATWADAHVLVDTGQPGSSDTIHAALQAIDWTRRSSGNLPEAVVRKLDGGWQSFGAARNAGLEFAREWARSFQPPLDGGTPAEYLPIGIMLDTDEVLLFGARPREVFQAFVDRGIGNFTTYDDRGEYLKDRGFDLRPENGAQYKGMTHEYAVKKGPSHVALPFTFHESAKDHAGNVEKFERDEKLLTQEILQHFDVDDRYPDAVLDRRAAFKAREREPMLSRWYFYLGSTIRHLGNPVAAAPYLELGAELDQNFPEQAAWCRWLIAFDVYFHNGAEESIPEHGASLLELCAKAFRHYPLPEVAWLIAKVYWHQNNMPLSLAWTRAAVAFLNAPRLNFRNVKAPIWIFDLFLWNPLCTPQERAEAVRALVELGAADRVATAPPPPPTAAEPQANPIESSAPAASTPQPAPAAESA